MVDKVIALKAAGIWMVTAAFIGLCIVWPIFVIFILGGLALFCAWLAIYAALGGR